MNNSIFFNEQVDLNLRKGSWIYDETRGINVQLEATKIYFVKSGSFQKLRDYILSNSTASVMQFKMPRRLRKKEWAELLLKQTV